MVKVNCLLVKVNCLMVTMPEEQLSSTFQGAAKAAAKARAPLWANQWMVKQGRADANPRPLHIRQNRTRVHTTVHAAADQSPRVAPACRWPPNPKPARPRAAPAPARHCRRPTPRPVTPRRIALAARPPHLPSPLNAVAAPASCLPRQPAICTPCRAPAAPPYLAGEQPAIPAARAAAWRASGAAAGERRTARARRRDAGRRDVRGRGV
jgi:hypothetical protein